jgi:hypothetical protein
MSIRSKEPRVRFVRNRKPIIDYDEEEAEEKLDYHEEQIIYARQPRKIYLPSNIRMICVTRNANRASYKKNSLLLIVHSYTLYIFGLHDICTQHVKATLPRALILARYTAHKCHARKCGVTIYLSPS